MEGVVDIFGKIQPATVFSLEDTCHLPGKHVESCCHACLSLSGPCVAKHENDVFGLPILIRYNLASHISCLWRNEKPVPDWRSVCHDPCMPPLEASWMNESAFLDQHPGDCGSNYFLLKTENEVQGCKSTQGQGSHETKWKTKEKAQTGKKRHPRAKQNTVVMG